tara:strand:+ start:1021 stop:1512 length:492 start_codon:yes stop_codon:yes gene_type:complete
MTETDKRYFIKRINEIKNELINNEPKTVNMTFSNWKDSFKEELNNVYKNLDKIKRNDILSNLFSKARDKIHEQSYYGTHSFSMNHVSIDIKNLIPDISRIQRELDELISKRDKEQEVINNELKDKTNEICDHIRFGDVEEFYGKTISEVMEEFKNFYTKNKAA